MTKTDLRSLDYTGTEALLLNLGEKKFRAKQIFDWVHKKGVSSFDEMSNLSKDLRNKLKDNCSLATVTTVTRLASSDDSTRKYLFELEDGQRIESVFMRYEHGNSVCVSTQAGCRMGCTFCASGLFGLDRNLTAGEILGQIYAIEEDTGERVSHTVLMGTGEPLDNYDKVLAFIHLLTDPMGKDMSQRHITLSTCGLVPEILRLAEEELQITLAISLHASEDQVRKRTMPIAKKYTIKEVLDACQVYFDKTGRRITFEYALIAGVNDSSEEATKLAALLRDRSFRCHVNLIPVNSVDENQYKQSDGTSVRRFQKVLSDRGVEATVRRAMGAEINAACGQLRKGDREKGQ